MNRRKLALVATAGLGLVVVLTWSVLARPTAEPKAEGVLFQSDSLTITQVGEWVTQDYAEAMPNSERLVIQGSKYRKSDYQGCRYRQFHIEQPRDLKPGQVRVQRPIRENDTTCQMEVETAVVSESVARQLGFSLDDEDQPGVGYSKSSGYGMASVPTKP